MGWGRMGGGPMRWTQAVRVLRSGRPIILRFPNLQVLVFVRLCAICGRCSQLCARFGSSADLLFTIEVKSNYKVENVRCMVWIRMLQMLPHVDLASYT